MADFDVASLALRAAFPTNSIITDDAGLPSVMVYIPKFKMSDVITGASDNVHPAFIVDGVEKDGIYISKYQNIVKRGRAYSIPGVDPEAGRMLDTSITTCNAKGNGWHIMTAMEWGAIALWCNKNGHLPKGNNNYGKDITESNYRARPTYRNTEGKVLRVATGTGPATWSHNGELDGIYDLNGNVCEWNSGVRLVYGELQIIANNDAANANNSIADDSTNWKAIDGTTGALITPDGQGTTTNSIKIDIDIIESKAEWITGAITTRSSDFSIATGENGGNITIADDVCESARETLYALALALADSENKNVGGALQISSHLADARLFRGGYWMNNGASGMFCSYLSSSKYDYRNLIGFRSAYYE